MRRISRVLLALAPLLAVALVLGAGETLSSPARARIGDAPHDLPARTIRIATPDGYVAGWVAPGIPGAGAVLLLHGVRANRLSMLARARFLSRRGYAVLLIDLPAHGESTGDRITFGAREKEGVRVALDFLAHQFPGERIGVIGVSLGAASLVLSHARPEPAAVVLESMYPTIGEAVANRLQMLGSVGRWLAPLLVQQLPLRARVSPDDLRPVDAIATLRSPAMVIAGAQDLHTPAAETQRVFAALPGPKQLWMVEGASHVDLHAFAPDQYERRVDAFLASKLRLN